MLTSHTAVLAPVVMELGHLILVAQVTAHHVHVAVHVHLDCRRGSKKLVLQLELYKGVIFCLKLYECWVRREHFLAPFISLYQ